MHTKGELIHLALWRQNSSPAKLARYVGVSDQTIRNWTRDVAQPRLGDLLVIAAVLEAPELLPDGVDPQRVDLHALSEQLKSIASSQAETRSTDDANFATDLPVQRDSLDSVPHQTPSNGAGTPMKVLTTAQLARQLNVTPQAIRLRVDAGRLVPVGKTEGKTGTLLFAPDDAAVTD